MKNFKEYHETINEEKIDEGLFKPSKEIKFDELKEKFAKAVERANSDPDNVHKAKAAEKLQRKISGVKFENGTMTAAKILGIGATGILSAWIISLLCLGASKAGTKMYENFKNSKLGNVGKFKESFNKEKHDMSVKDQLNSVEEKKRKFEDVLGGVYKSIEEDDFDSAHEEYMKLSNAQRAMPEINQSVIEACTKHCGEPPLYVKTPGNITYQRIKQVTGDIRIARAAALAVQEKIKQMAAEDEE